MLINPATFVRIYDKGVLITGEPGAGKSELALELVDRGHALIADDTVDIFIDDHGELLGQCPEASRGLLHLSDIGLINPQMQYGEKAIFQQPHAIDFIIELTASNRVNEARLKPFTTSTVILGHEIQTICLPPKTHQLALKVECLSSSSFCSARTVGTIREA